MRSESGRDCLQQRNGQGLRAAHREAEGRGGKDACALSTPARLRAKMRESVAAHPNDLEARHERAQLGECMEARRRGGRAGSQGDGAGAHTGLGATVQLDLRGRWGEARAAPTGSNPGGAEREAGRYRRGRGFLADHAYGRETGGARSNPTLTICGDAGSPVPILAHSVHSCAGGRNNSDSCDSDSSVQETLFPLFASVSLSTHVFSQALPRLQGETSRRGTPLTFYRGDIRWWSRCERRAPAFSPTTGACGPDRTGPDVRVQPPRRPTSSVCAIPTTSPTSAFSGLTGSTLFLEGRKQAEVRPSGHFRDSSWPQLHSCPEVRSGHFRNSSWPELHSFPEVRPSGHSRDSSWQELNSWPEVRTRHFPWSSWKQVNLVSEVRTEHPQWSSRTKLNWAEVSTRREANRAVNVSTPGAIDAAVHGAVSGTGDLQREGAHNMAARSKKTKGAAGNSKDLKGGVARHGQREISREDMDMSALGEALKAEALEQQAAAGAACGMGKKQEARMRQADRFAQQIEAQAARKEEAKRQEKATKASLENIHTINQELAERGLRLDDAVMLQAIAQLRTLPQAQQVAEPLLRQSINTTLYLARTEDANAPSGSLRARTVGLMERGFGTQATVRLRLMTALGMSSDQARQARLSVERWARSQGQLQLNFLPDPEGPQEHAVVAIIFKPPHDLIQKSWSGPRIQLGSEETATAFEHKLLLNPQHMEADLTPLAGQTAPLQGIAKVLRAMGLSVGQMEDYFLRCLQQTCEPHLAKLFLYIRVELARRTGEKTRRLDPFLVGSSAGGGGPRITVGMADTAKLSAAVNTQGKIFIGPSPSNHLLSAEVVLGEYKRPVQEWPSTQKEACKALREETRAALHHGDEVWSTFDRKAQELLQEGEKGISTTQLSQVLDELLLYVRKEQDLRQMIHGPCMEIYAAMGAEDGDAGMRIRTLLTKVQSEVKTFAQGPWRERKDQMGIIWVKPQSEQALRTKVKEHLKTRRPGPQAWKEATESLLRSSTDLGQGTTLQIFLVGMMVTPTSLFDLGGGFPIMIQNAAEVHGRLSKSRKLWLAGCEGEGKWMEEEVAETSLALSIVTKCREGIFFFAPLKAVDEAHDRNSNQRRATRVSVMMPVSDDWHWHVTKVAATLGITKELTEYIMEDLGDLRRQGILEAIALPEAEVVAYGLRVYVQTLDRGASTTKWSQGLALEGDNKALIERELDFTVRAAIHKAAAGGCWKEGKEVGVMGVQDLLADVALEFNPLGSSTMARALAHLPFLESRQDMGELVAKALQTLLRDDDIRTWIIGGHTLYLRAEYEVQVDGLPEGALGISAGDSLPHECIGLVAERLEETKEKVLHFLRSRSILTPTSADDVQDHWVFVQERPKFARELGSAALERELARAQVQGAARLSTEALANIIRTDCIHTIPPESFVPQTDSWGGWIPVQEFSLGHALQAYVEGPLEQIAWTTVRTLQEEGRALQLGHEERRAFASPRMMPTLILGQEPISECFSGIFERMSQRIIKQKSSDWPQELMKAVQADEEEVLTEILEGKPLPVLLPIQQGATFDELTSTIVERLYEVVGHPLVTTPRGFELFNEVLTKRSRFRACKVGLVAFDKADALFEVDQHLLDALDPQDAKAFENLRRALNKRGRDEDEDDGEEAGQRATAKPSPAPK